jgi:hypothetical protein
MSSSLDMANNMPSSDDEDMTETRFSNLNPVIQTQRVMLDVSEIPVGLFPSKNDDNSVDGSDVNNLRLTMVPAIRVMYGVLPAVIMA